MEKPRRGALSPESVDSQEYRLQMKKDILSDVVEKKHPDLTPLTRH